MTHLQFNRTCGYCKAVLRAGASLDEVEMWAEFHDPWWCPAHRKCSKYCEDAASEILSQRLCQPAEGEDLNGVTK